jgi:predicted AAA+ superfamily ATPase
MRRYAMQKLKNWLVSEGRKPLVLRGARQVGKTWLVRALAADSQRALCEINFEKKPEWAVHFESNDPVKILKNLEAALNQSISPDQSILFLDEIQAAPELFAKLRWFYEQMPELPVIAAGSLLEFELADHSFSMPVGRISYLFLEPLGFEEFLLAKEEEFLLGALQSVTLQDPLNDVLHEKACELFKEYLMVGGMPEAVAAWTKHESWDALSAVHHDLISTYKDDFAKYAGRLSTTYLDQVLNAIPRLLAKKFVYSQVNPDARHGSLKQAVDLLIQARVCHVVQGTHANGIPMGSEIDSKVFKLILMDVGLVSSLLGLKLHTMRGLEEVMLVNKGALAEQVVGQLLRLLFPGYMSPHLYYWSRSVAGSSAEIDYLIQQGNILIPVEVKSGSEGKMRSLHQFVSEKNWTRALRVYEGPLSWNKIETKTTQGKPVIYDLLSLPFYLLEQAERFFQTVFTN